MIGKYFSQMSNRRGSVDSCDERDASSPGKKCSFLCVVTCGASLLVREGDGGGHKITAGVEEHRFLM